jgi:hypothetical protein
LPPPFLSICIEYSITKEDVHILLECIPLNITPSHEEEIKDATKLVELHMLLLQLLY